MPVARSSTVASIEGLEGTAGGSVYSASKGGVVLLTKSMAIDYAGRGIRVNAVCPGFIDTPMPQGVFDWPGLEAAKAEVVAEHKLRRLGRADEIAAATAFLLLGRCLVHHRPRPSGGRGLHGGAGPRCDRDAGTLGARALASRARSERWSPDLIGTSRPIGVGLETTGHARQQITDPRTAVTWPPWSGRPAPRSGTRGWWARRHTDWAWTPASGEGA